MRFVPLKRMVVASIFSVAACAVGSGAASADWLSGPFPRVCALQEIKVITLIEEHGEAADVPSDRLAEAGLAMLRARAACYEGRVAEAIALYDEILRIVPTTSAQRH
jgi:hypothetical protein